LAAAESDSQLSAGQRIRASRAQVQEEYGNRHVLPGQPYDRARRQLVLPPQYKLDIFTTENVPNYLRAAG